MTEHRAPERGETRILSANELTELVWHFVQVASAGDWVRRDIDAIRASHAALAECLAAAEATIAELRTALACITGVLSTQDLTANAAGAAWQIACEALAAAPSDGAGKEGG